MRNDVFPALNAVRAAADKLETIVADDLWPLPTYREMLFIKLTSANQGCTDVPRASPGLANAGAFLFLQSARTLSTPQCPANEFDAAADYETNLITTNRDNSLLGSSSRCTAGTSAS
jgi:hypothetical protein